MGWLELIDNKMGPLGLERGRCESRDGRQARVRENRTGVGGRASSTRNYSMGRSDSVIIRSLNFTAVSPTVPP